MKFALRLLNMIVYVVKPMFFRCIHSHFCPVFITAVAGASISLGEPRWLCEPGLWSRTPVLLQVDCQLALPSWMAFLESLLPLGPAGCSPDHIAAFCFVPLEKVSLTCCSKVQRLTRNELKHRFRQANSVDSVLGFSRY